MYFQWQNLEGQDWGKIETGIVKFNQMGANIMYMVMYYARDKYYPGSDPFILDSMGKVKYVLPHNDHKLKNMLLLRKYPSHPGNINNMARMFGGCFQGADKADFSDAVDLFTIQAIPSKVEEVKLNVPGRYRYLRYLAPAASWANIAELEFYGDNGKLSGTIIGFPKVRADEGNPYSNAFDGDPGTFFAGGIKDSFSWVGLDLKQRKKIVGVRYCPRSDTNFILTGDTYELSYWLKDKWISLGKQVAQEQFLVYNNVPANGLYLLHNLSRGKEERIFTYENEQQVWW